MCLGIPGQITAIVEEDQMLARVEVSGVSRKVNVVCVADPGALDALVGKWVLIHVGFAMSIIDEEEAARTIQVLDELGDMQQELSAMRASALP